MAGWQCAVVRQYVAVRAAVCGNVWQCVAVCAAGWLRVVHAAVCISAVGSVEQFAWQCVAVRQCDSVRQCGSVRIMTILSLFSQLGLWAPSSSGV
jgi:hypothetical protein